MSLPDLINDEFARRIFFGNSRVARAVRRAAGGITADHFAYMSRTKCWHDIRRQNDIGPSTLRQIREILDELGLDDMPFWPQYRFGWLRRHLHFEAKRHQWNIETEKIRARRMARNCPVVRCDGTWDQRHRDKLAHYGTEGYETAICDNHDCCDDFVEQLDICRDRKSVV